MSAPSGITSLGLGVAWGVLLAWPVARWARRPSVAARLRAAGHRPAGGRPASSWRRFGSLPGLRVGAAVVARRRGRRRSYRLERELPIVTDLLAMAVGAGATPTHAVDLAAAWAPPAARGCLARARDAQRHGAGLGDALELATGGDPAWSPVVEALLAGDRLGAPIVTALARVAEAQRAQIRRAAEAHARRVPVRLLFPLVFLVLPAFGLLTVVPVLVSGLTDL